MNVITHNKTCPCKDCGDRQVGCHSSCDKYIDWSKQQAELKQKERLEKDIWNDRYFTPARRIR